jgi:dTDP-4-dehydrorhamnose reductase
LLIIISFSHRAGCTEGYADFFMGPVHVEDVAMAHILVFENPSASGRHMCVQSICHWSDFAAKVAELYPNYKVPKYAKPHIFFHQENQTEI